MATVFRWVEVFREKRAEREREKVLPPFAVMVYKEVCDHVRSWRFLILGALMVLTCMGSLYTAITNLAKSVAAHDPAAHLFFLKLFTVSDGSLPPFHVFIAFLGPLIGISLGFVAFISDQITLTLTGFMAKPVHRDYLLNAKFVASLIVFGVLFFPLPLWVFGSA